MQQALFQKQSESGSLQMYPVTSVQTIHAISCKTTIYRYIVCRFGHNGPRAYGILNAEQWKQNGHNERGDGNIIGHYERRLKYIFLFDLSIIID